jgi:pyruvate/2-oxoglutarate dehydrogenase complex dihydrolipoamide dehydrogenase (E3) component
MYDLVVIGGGAGGLSVATAAAKVGAKVALVERQQPGGETTLSACVPSKGLVQAARRLQQVRSAEALGLKVGPIEVDFPAVMARIRSVAEALGQGASAESLRARGIDVYHGSAAFEAYDTVRVDAGTTITGYRFVIATGARAAVPSIPGLAEAGYLDDRSLWSLENLPESLIILGAGPNAVEFAQCFARFGSKVTVVTDSPRILPDEDADVSGYVADFLGAEGVALRPGVAITKVEPRGDRKVCILQDVATGETGEVAGSHLLLAAGRLAQVDGLNLEAADVHAEPEHGIVVDDHLQTDSPRVYAIGDVLLRHQYVHAAEREAEVAFANAVLRRRKRIDYSAIPRVTFTDPEVAGVRHDRAPGAGRSARPPGPSRLVRPARPRAHRWPGRRLRQGGRDPRRPHPGRDDRRPRREPADPGIHPCPREGAGARRDRGGDRGLSDLRRHRARAGGSAHGHAAGARRRPDRPADLLRIHAAGPAGQRGGLGRGVRP